MYRRFPCIQAFRDVDTICDFFSLQTGVEGKNPRQNDVFCDVDDAWD